LQRSCQRYSHFFPDRHGSRIFDFNHAAKWQKLDFPDTPSEFQCGSHMAQFVNQHDQKQGCQFQEPACHD